MTGYRVLIVDDDEATHDVVGTYLRLAGFRVSGCRDGSDAPQVASDVRPDLILLDIQMPVRNGFDTIEALRRDPSLRDVPVLFLSSLRREDFKVRGLELGAEDYITKPCSKPELLARIRAAVRRSRRYRRVQGVLEGELAQIGLATLLQTLELGRKSGVISLPDLDAEIVVSEGALAQIRLGTIHGDDALARALFVDKGHFSVAMTDVATSADAALSRGTMGALMAAMQSVDDARRSTSPMFDDNPLLELGEGAKVYPLLAEWAELSPVLAHTLIVRMSGTLEQNALVLRRAFDEGLVTVFGDKPLGGEAI